MRMLLKLAGAGLAALMPVNAADAAEQLLDFTQGNYCNGGNLCTNNSIIDNGYGDTAGVDMTYSSLNAQYAGIVGGAHYYEFGYGDLTGVIYGNRGDGFGLISFEAKDGYEISLRSFDMGCFAGSSLCAVGSYEVYSGSRYGAGDGEFVVGNGYNSTNYPAHSNVVVDSRYYKNLYLRFGGHENVGLDNIRFDVRQISAAVPEPATWAMMILGFGAIGHSMRRRPRTRRVLA